MNADPIARVYRWLEYAAFGGRLERSRFYFLEQTLPARRILVAGEGDGRFLRGLVAFNHKAMVDVIDASAAMIALAEERVPAEARGRVRFHQRDLLQAPLLPGPYDLVITHYFLDCFQTADSAAIIADLAEALRPGGLWILSDFQLPAAGWRRMHARVWLWAMYAFFQLATGLKARRLPPYEAQLTRAGMKLEMQWTEGTGLIGSQVWRKPG